MEVEKSFFLLTNHLLKKQMSFKYLEKWVYKIESIEPL